MVVYGILQLHVNILTPINVFCVKDWIKCQSSIFLMPGTVFKRSEEPRSPDQNMARRALEDSSLGDCSTYECWFWMMAEV